MMFTYWPYNEITLTRLKSLRCNELSKTWRFIITKAKGKVQIKLSNKEPNKIMWFKNKNTKIRNKNTKYARLLWKWIFIMLTYANMNMNRTWQSYGVRSCLRLLLNKLKEMRGLTFIYTFLRTQLKEVSKKAFVCALSKEVFWKPS